MNMYYISKALAVFMLATANFIIVENSFLEDALEKGLNLTCNAFTNAILEVRELDKDLHSADVKFHTYEDGEDDEDDILTFFYEGDETIDFDKNVKKLVVIIHGYMGDSDAVWIQNLTDALFKWEKNEMNVVVVDWFKSYNYYVAAAAVKEVAEETYDALEELAEKYDKENVQRPELHIMGHSLGAHIASLTAKKLKDVAGWNVDRITAFDPARPFFEEEKGKSYFKEYRLNKSYANFVDVIHTNSQSSNATFGLYDPLGHIDFYPNGGDHQPACKGVRNETPKKRTAKLRSRKSKQMVNPKRSKKSIKLCVETSLSRCLKNLGAHVSCLASEYLVQRRNMVCDHSKAQDYFTESLEGLHYHATKFNHSQSFLNKDLKCYAGNKCLSDVKCAEMGINAINYKGIREGTYYVNTTCRRK